MYEYKICSNLMIEMIRVNHSDICIKQILSFVNIENWIAVKMATLSWLVVSHVVYCEKIGIMTSISFQCNMSLYSND